MNPNTKTWFYPRKIPPVLPGKLSLSCKQIRNTFYYVSTALRQDTMVFRLGTLVCRGLSRSRLTLCP